MSNSSIVQSLGYKDAGVFGILLALYWTQTNLLVFVRGIFVRILGESIAPYFVPLVFIFAAILCMSIILRGTRWIDYVLVALFASYFYYCLNTMPQNAIFLRELESQAIFWALPMFFIGLAVNYKQCEKIIYWLSYISVLLQFYQVIFGRATMSTNSQGDIESMGMSYGVLSAALYMIWVAVEYTRPRDIFVAILSVILIFSMGSRGPLVCLILYILIYFLFFKKYDQPIRTRSVIIGLGAIVFYLLDDIVLLLGSVASSLGLSTRILDFFLSGDLAAEMGRDTIRENLIEAIQHSPFWGYGFGADRYLSNFYDSYAHNLFLELLIDFGPIPGSVFIALLALLIYIAIKNSPNYETRMFIIIIMMSCVGSLFFSGSYLTSYRFFFALGVFLAVIRGTKSKLT